MAKKFEKGKMVPVPSHSIIPERDIDKSPILECSHLGIDFGGLKAVDDFNLTIGRTEIAGLIGPNGAGKTTVFNLLTKVYQPTRGTILLDGLDTSGKTTAQINRMGIARTFQNIRLFNNLSVEDNVKIGLHNQEKYSALTGVLRLPKYAGPGGPQGRIPALRRPAPAGDCPGAGHQPLPAVAGRASRGHEPLGDGGADGEHRQDPGHLPHCRHAY